MSYRDATICESKKEGDHTVREQEKRTSGMRSNTASGMLSAVVRHPEALKFVIDGRPSHVLRGALAHQRLLLLVSAGLRSSRRANTIGLVLRRQISFGSQAGMSDRTHEHELTMPREPINFLFEFMVRSSYHCWARPRDPADLLPEEESRPEPRLRTMEAADTEP